MESEGFTMSRSPNSLRQLPIAVQTVVEFGFPLKLVMSTYTQLSAGSQAHGSTQLAKSHQAGLEATSGRDCNSSVHAKELFLAVEALRTRSSAADDKSAEVITMISEETTGAGRVTSDLHVDEDGATSSKSKNAHQESSTAANDSNGFASEAADSANTIKLGTESSINTISNDTSLVPADVLSTPVSATDLDSKSAETSEEAAAEKSRPQAVTDAIPNTPSETSSSQTSDAVSTTSTSSENAQSGLGPLGDSTLVDEKARERRRQLTKLRALREENRRLKERQWCRHCRRRPVEMTLLPCGHFCFCMQCGASFNACPLCGKTIAADVRTFVS